VRPISLLLPLCLFLSLGAAAQGIQTEFGKNRVQYGRDFDEWVFYESQNFITYWYGEGRMVGQAASMIAEAEHDDIQRLLEHRVNDKIEIIVYVDLSDLKQSNIGTEDAFTNATGRTKIFGNKIFVYFNGSHADLRRQIREGIAGVYLESMMLGANLQEYVQNSILFNMPTWFRDGLIAYAGAGWDTQADDRLRTLFANPRLGDFEDFLKEDPVLAGRAFWHYLSLQYGRAAVANILYIARIYRDVGEGMLYVLGTPYPTVAEGWYNHFRERYDSERSQFDPEPSERIALRNRRNDPLTRLAVCPDGKRLAYVLNRIGRVRVYVQDLESGKRKKAFGYGFRNGIQETDYQYPHIAWHPSGRILAVLYERRDKLHLVQLDLDTGKERGPDPRRAQDVRHQRAIARPQLHEPERGWSPHLLPGVDAPRTDAFAEHLRDLRRSDEVAFWPEWFLLRIIGLRVAAGGDQEELLDTHRPVLADLCLDETLDLVHGVSSAGPFR